MKALKLGVHPHEMKQDIALSFVLDVRTGYIHFRYLKHLSHGTTEQFLRIQMEAPDQLDLSQGGVKCKTSFFRSLGMKFSTPTHY